MSSIDAYADFVDGLIEDYQRPRVKLDPGGGEYRLRTMLDIVKWAHDHQPIQAGDRVVISKQKIDAIKPDSGWYHYRDKMREFGLEVVDVHFNKHAKGFWVALTRIDGKLFAMPMHWVEKVEYEIAI